MTLETYLHRWLLLHNQQFLEAAVADIDGATALAGALDEGVLTNSLLHGLDNTAHSCSYKEMIQYVDKRAQRRRKVAENSRKPRDEMEADFWEATSRLLKNVVHEQSAQLLSAGQQAGLIAATDMDPKLERRVHQLIARTYLAPFVAHCLYRLNQK